MRSVKLMDETLQKELHLQQNFDIIRRVVSKKYGKVILYYLTSLIGEVGFMNIMNCIRSVRKADEIIQEASIPSVSEVQTLEKAKIALFSGGVLLFFEKENRLLIADIRSYPTRGMQEPEAEKAVRGSRDGFTETLMINVGLLRRRIKDDRLRIEHYIVAEKSKMSVALVYLQGEIDETVLQLLQEKLKTIDVDSLIMTDRALEEQLFQQQKSIYPLVRYTERPDVAAIQVMNGKAVILVDTSSSAILTPVTLVDHSKHVEEYRQTPMVGSFTRMLRAVSIFLSLFLVPLWLCLVTDQDVQNSIFSLAVSDAYDSPLLAQVLIASLLMEIFRIAMIHTPNSLTSGLSLVAAIILGQVSMDLGLFLPEILLFVAIQAICGFATPSYELSLANKVVSLLFIVISAFFRFEGLLLATLFLFLYLVRIQVFSLPYLYPICPFDLHSFKHIFVREDAKKRKKC